MLETNAWRVGSVESSAVMWTEEGGSSWVTAPEVLKCSQSVSSTIMVVGSKQNSSVCIWYLSLNINADKCVPSKAPTTTTRILQSRTNLNKKAPEEQRLPPSAHLPSCWDFHLELVGSFMSKATWLQRSKVNVFPESGSSSNGNHLFLGPLSTVSENFIKISSKFPSYFLQHQTNRQINVGRHMTLFTEVITFPILFISLRNDFL